MALAMQKSVYSNLIMGSSRKVICALDTSDLNEALNLVKRLSGHVGAFKIGHSLTLPYGLDVIKRLQDAGADRIFLDLKFHDIPNTVALAVREATKNEVWMMTVHIAGGPAMLTAAVEESHYNGIESGPMLVGVSCLTSLDQHILTDHLGVNRTIEEHMVYLSKLAVELGLEGVVSSPAEVRSIRTAIGHEGVIVTPGIRAPGASSHDQVRIGTAQQALEDGADYLVMGRSIFKADDPAATLVEFGLLAETSR